MQFACVKCRRPLRIEADKGLESSTLIAFRGGEGLDEELQRQEGKALDALVESFVVLPERKGAPSLDKQFSSMSAVLEVASDKTQIDQPLCQSCCDAITSELTQRLGDVVRDRDAYRSMLDGLSAASSAAAGTSIDTDAEASRLEEELTHELARLRQERTALKTEQQALEDESKTLDVLEAKFWDEYQQLQLELDAVGGEHGAVRQRLRVSSDRLERLKRTNVFDDAFHISYDGHFATINGFRLGNLQSQKVDWQETNAALGQVVLLLDTIAKRCNFNFTKYRLLPMGSFSKMCKIDDPKTQYELYGSNDLSLGRIFWYPRFDTALVWLLYCIKELGDYAASQDKRFKLRYAIKDDVIGDVSIKCQFQQDAKWTKALKYMLTNLKYLLVYAAKTS